MTRHEKHPTGIRLLLWALVICMLLACIQARAQEPRVQVDRFVVSGNTLLSASQIDAVLSGYTGERSLAELKQAALAVQALYRASGYGAVIAFLPEQSSSGGQVAIRVVEGKVSRVVVTGQQRFDEANIRSSLPALQEGQTPRIRDIDAQIQLANENPSKEIEVLLQPGERPGEVEARIQVAEGKVPRFSFALNDTGARNPSRLRAGFGYEHAALWDLDHVLSLHLQLAPEAIEDLAVVSANYRIPLYGAGMAIDAYAAYSDVDGGSTPTAAGALQFAGKGRIAGLRVSRYLPRLGEIDQRLVVGLDHRDYINDCSIVGLPAGACGSAGESVSVQPVSIEYILQKGGQNPWGATLGVQHNLQFGGGRSGDDRFSAIRPGSTPRYTLLRFGFFGGYTLPGEWLLQARLTGQFSDDALVPGEQFGIGGANSVRGYEERELTADRGAAGTIELWSPPIGLPQPGAQLRALVFGDAGWLQNRLGTPCRNNADECRLGSVGVGLRFSAGPLQARIDIAQALRSAATTRRSDVRAHFSLSYSY